MKTTRLIIGDRLWSELYAHEYEVVRDQPSSALEEPDRGELAEAIHAATPTPKGWLMVLTPAAVDYLRRDAIGGWIGDWEEQGEDELYQQARVVLRRLRRATDR